MTQIPATQNEGWGFYGTIGHFTDATTAWNIALPAIAAATGCDYAEARAFLDSRHGRHFADDVSQTGPLTAAIDAAIARWMAWTIDRRISRETGIPHGLPYLTGFVHDAAIAEEV